ncbi:hypothetical protein 7S3_46 [uncultured Caudovirales phage]|uniref:4Fe-4S Wbl-type domain-containing protein n=1 Tax=uncultured Caudovirales phage TaxID=2100421 RepID=A0A2H4J2A7_9CAUD|nr:hypothetical protein 7S3_46 [uncultured Caudovirales phage]
MIDWKTRGHCYTQDPERWDVDNLTPGRETQEAQALCHRCPVIQECAADAIKPIDMTSILGTYEPPDVIHVSGVVRAGVVT